jgi:opacity protein-like surface antigen
MKAHALQMQTLRIVRFVFGVISLVCLFTIVSGSAAHAQGYPPPGYPPPAYPPPPYPPPSYPPSTYPPRYPPQSYPPRRRPDNSGYSLFEPKYTFSLFVGTRFGGNIAIDTPNVDSLPIRSSLNWGFNAGARVAPHLFTEFMWNRQTTALSAHDVPTDQTVTLTNNAHLDMYQASLLYEIWARSQLRPYVVGGIGFTHFDSHGILSFSNRFAYNLGGGVKYLFAPQVALRAEMRWSPSRTTSSDTTFCDPFLGCFVTPVSNHAEQWQANLGVEFRF